MHLVLACALLVTGSGGAVAHAATPTAATPSALATLTITKAKAIAAAGVLRSTDLPGYARERNALDDESRTAAAEFATCTGRRLGPYLARNAGYTYENSTTQITSSVDVARTLAIAAADKATLMSAKGRQCLLDAFKADAGAQGVSIVSAKFTRISATLPGADSTYGYVLDMGLVVSGTVATTARLILLGSNVGRAELSLTVLSGTQTSVSKAKALQLLGTAVKRAKRASA